MRAFFGVVLVAALLAGLPGCAGTQRITEAPPAGATAQQQSVADAQEVIAQATRGLLNAQALLLQEIDSPVFTDAEKRSAQAQLKQVREGLERANKALKAGDVAAALKNAADANALADQAENFLEQDLAARRRKSQ